eukprot:TRINITY_DN1405_c0_g1_i1.p1 TRINITY_DN1405_c0_g1~~TRINITY_DN1405_c0_g1_i1.p1  ORF type:complete len:798 (+),score=304.91 TRINITY_DN1405_c0_g1_i1:55-2448(+)
MIGSGEGPAAALSGNRMDELRRSYQQMLHSCGVEAAPKQPASCKARASPAAVSERAQSSTPRSTAAADGRAGLSWNDQLQVWAAERRPLSRCGSSVPSPAAAAAATSQSPVARKRSRTWAEQVAEMAASVASRIQPTVRREPAAAAAAVEEVSWSPTSRGPVGAPAPVTDASTGKMRMCGAVRPQRTRASDVEARYEAVLDDLRLAAAFVPGAAAYDNDGPRPHREEPTGLPIVPKPVLSSPAAAKTLLSPPVTPQWQVLTGGCGTTITSGTNGISGESTLMSPGCITTPQRPRKLVPLDKRVAASPSQSHSVVEAAELARRGRERREEREREWKLQQEKYLERQRERQQRRLDRQRRRVASAPQPCPLSPSADSQPDDGAAVAPVATSPSASAAEPAASPAKPAASPAKPAHEPEPTPDSVAACQDHERALIQADEAECRRQLCADGPGEVLRLAVAAAAGPVAGWVRQVREEKEEEERRQRAEASRRGAWAVVRECVWEEQTLRRFNSEDADMELLQLMRHIDQWRVGMGSESHPASVEAAAREGRVGTVQEEVEERAAVVCAMVSEWEDQCRSGVAAAEGSAREELGSAAAASAARGTVGVEETEQRTAAAKAEAVERSIVSAEFGADLLRCIDRVTWLVNCAEVDERMRFEQQEEEERRANCYEHVHASHSVVRWHLEQTQKRQRSERALVCTAADDTVAATIAQEDEEREMVYRLRSDDRVEMERAAAAAKRAAVEAAIRRAQSVQQSDASPTADRRKSSVRSSARRSVGRRPTVKKISDGPPARPPPMALR